MKKIWKVIGLLTLVTLFMAACAPSAAENAAAVATAMAPGNQAIVDAINAKPNPPSADEVSGAVAQALQPTPTPTPGTEELLKELIDELRVGDSDDQVQPTPGSSGREQVMSTPESVTGGSDLFSNFDKFIAAVALPCPAGEECIPLDVRELSFCPAEDSCIRALREKNELAVIIPYYGTNPTSCVQDGWMHSVEDRENLGRKAPPEAVGSGVPAGYIGLLEGMTLRPCPAP